MAHLEQRGNGWRIVLRHGKKRVSFALPRHANGQPLTVEEAKQFRKDAEFWLYLIERRFVTPTPDLVTFLVYRGRPPADKTDYRDRPYTLTGLRHRYMQSSAYKRLSTGTRQCQGYHFDHLLRHFGKTQPLHSIRLEQLQAYVDKRSREAPYANRHRKSLPGTTACLVSANTIRQELKTLRCAWTWARNFDGLATDYPLRKGIRLTFPKTSEKMPFMTLEEAKQLFDSGQAQEDIFDSIYLLHEEVEQILEHVCQQRLPAWVYPFFVFAAHTGARRSEMLRSLCADVRLDESNGGVVRIRECKRDPTKATFRTVPLTPLLRQVLTPLLNRPGQLFLDQQGNPIERHTASWYFHRALRGSPFCVLRGWHVFRHTFRSLLTSNGVDERTIDGLLGHFSEEQRRRYRHLYPKVATEAVCRVFGKMAATAATAAPSH